MTSQQELTQTEATLVLDGELNIYNVTRIKLELQNRMQEGTDLWVDLSQVTEVDTSGLQLLLAAHMAMKQAGKKLQLINPSEAVQDYAARCNFSLSFAVPLNAGDSQ
jgi:anti-sigma B factor antagonist